MQPEIESCQQYRVQFWLHDTISCGPQFHEMACFAQSDAMARCHSGWGSATSQSINRQQLH